MVDASELWIGDVLRVKTSGKKGIFHGVAEDGRVRLKVKNKMLRVRAKNLELVPESVENDKLTKLKQEILEKRLDLPPLTSVIDLHIEKLNPNLMNAVPERIVDFQIKAFEKYMEDVTRANFKFVTVIHGKGTGTLRAHIHSFLGSMEEVSAFHLVNNNGATEVLLH